MAPQTAIEAQPQLNYDILPNKSPLYTTVDGLNQSTADLQVTAKNNTANPVTIYSLLVELTSGDPDKVQLMQPGSASGIPLPAVTGPGQSTWNVSLNNGTAGQFSLIPNAGSVTFQAGDSLTFTLQNVVIREGSTGTAFVIVREGSDAGRGETEVGIGITESTLTVQLSSDFHLIEPNGTATLSWITTDATSGSLYLPDQTIPLHANTNLVTGQWPVSPVVDTTYSLTCQGRGPDVTSAVTVSVDSLQMGQLEASAEIVHVADPVFLQWHTNADTCTLDDGSGNQLSVPTTVPNTQYPNCYQVNPKTPTTYTVQGTKKLGNGDYVDEPAITNSVDVYPVQLIGFTSSANAFDASQTITLSWQTVDAVTCALSTKEGTGSVNVQVANGQTASCKVSATPDGQTLIVTSADGSNQELGRITLPVPCPGSTTFVLSATGVNPKTMTSEVTLIPPQIDTFTGQADNSYYAGSIYSNWEFLSLSWSTSHASSVNVDVGSQAVGVTTELTLAGLNLPSGSCFVARPQGEVTITCQGFGGPITRQQNF